MLKARRVVIVGAGAVGSTFAYTLMHSGLAGEIVLLDIDQARAEGEAMDLNHGLFFAPPVAIRAGDYDDCAEATVVVITAGAKQRPGESRLEQVRDSAYHVIESKGATYYGVSMALERIVGAILRDENSVLTVSTRTEGRYNLPDVCLSLPVVVNRQGVDRVIEAELNEEELVGLRNSAEVLRNVIESVEI